MKKTILLLLMAAGLSSCNDWFDVTASNEIREEKHYSTELGFKQTLIGCYIAMGEEDLFGKNLTWLVPELMGHQYRPYTTTASSAVMYSFQDHLYTNTYAKPVIEAIWEKAYNVIGNANEALKFIDEKKAIFDPINYHVVKGELLAVRAYMHFQLLRLYGLGDWENRAATLNAKPTIPYVTTLSKEMTPQATGAEAIKALLKDLADAAALLKEYDPVVSKLDWSAYELANEDEFLSSRNAHLNYYAVKALQAQVYMWEGSAESKAEALQAAEEIITATGSGIEKMESVNGSPANIFTLKFLTPSTLLSPNYSMIPESLFALSIQRLDTKLNAYLDPYYRDTDYEAIYVTKDAGESLYENQTSDIRFTTLLQMNASASNVGYVPMKLYQTTSMYDFYKSKIPMIRLPEIYYIAAECHATGATPNLEKAMEYLNTVRENRGLYTVLENLTAAEIQAEIKKEYQKEFLCEGVMFYYYKRLGETAIPRTDSMSDENYVLPYPDFEIQSGRVQ